MTSDQITQSHSLMGDAEFQSYVIATLTSIEQQLAEAAKQNRELKTMVEKLGRMGSQWAPIPQQPTKKHMLEALNEDILGEVCKLLDLRSLMALVRALDGVPRYRALQQTAANTPVYFDATKEPYLQADVLKYLKKVDFHTYDLDQIQFFSKKLPGYLFSVEVNWYGGNEFSGIADLPSTTTAIKLEIDTLVDEFVPVKEWPSHLSSLLIESNAKLKVGSLPLSLRQLSIEAPTVSFEGSFPPLDSLELWVREPTPPHDTISTKELKVWKWGQYSVSSLTRFVQKCENVETFYTNVPDLEWPEEATHFGVVGDREPTDPRITDLTLVHARPSFDLPNLTRLDLLATFFEGLYVPATVTWLRLKERGLDDESGLDEVLMSQIANVNSIKTLHLEGDSLVSLCLPSLRKWTSLTTFSVRQFLMPTVVLDAPRLNSVTIYDCRLKDFELMCPELRVLKLTSNKLTSLPKLPDTVQVLAIPANAFSGELTVLGKGITDLIVDSNRVKLVRYDSKQLQLADATWGDLEYFGPIGGEITTMPQYFVSSIESRTLGTGTRIYNDHTTEFRLTMGRGKQIKIPPATELLEINFLSFESLMLTTPTLSPISSLKYLGLSVYFDSTAKIRPVPLPRLAVFISIYFAYTDVSIPCDTEEIWLSFDGPTKLECLHVRRLNVRWETIGGKALHPNLSVVNGKPSNLLEE